MRIERLISRARSEETRNSRLRELTAEPIEKIVKRLHHRFPGLSPDHLTALGTIGVVLGSYLAERQKRKEAGAILTISSLADAFDGPLARVAPETAKPWGQILDACSDRIQELVMAWSRLIQAHHRGDRTGKILACLAAFSNPLPSIARSSAEASGGVVPETGKGVMGLFGTRSGRAIAGIAATVFPEIRGVPVQWALDALTVTANTVTTIDRLRQRRQIEADSDGLGPEKEQEAVVRNRALIALGGVIFGATAFTYAYLRRKKEA